MTTNAIDAAPFKSLFNEATNPVFAKFNRHLMIELEISREEIRLLRNKVSELQMALDSKLEPEE